MSDTATQTASPVRSYEGADFPAAGVWAIDPAHTSVEFSVKHLMVAKVKGQLSNTSGVITVAEDPTASTAEITLQAGTIDTGVDDRNAHLKSPDFLEVEAYPEITFRSTSFRHEGGTEWTLTGDLTIHGVTKSVDLSTEFNGIAVDPWGGTRAVYSAETRIDREEWGLTWNQALEAGGWLVGKEIRIALEVESVRQ